MGVLAVTGSTGNVGGRVARLLTTAGVPQRLVVRDPARAPALPGATVVTAHYADPQAARKALDGVETLFMVSGAEAADRVDQHRTFIDAGLGLQHGNLEVERIGLILLGSGLGLECVDLVAEQFQGRGFHRSVSGLGESGGGRPGGSRLRRRGARPVVRVNSAVTSRPRPSCPARKRSGPIRR